MSRFPSLCVTAGLMCAGAALWPALAADGNAEDITVRHFPTYWLQDRTAQDDFLPPTNGFGPVVAELGHPYVPNGAGKQQTSPIADLANPILKPWVIEQMAKPKSEMGAG